MPPGKGSPPAAGRSSSRKMQRPYERYGITTQDQVNYQRKLLEAAASYDGFSKENMQIIAISFEHKVFTEARSPREYRKLIRNKLKDWDYQALSDSEPEADEHDLEMTTVPHEPSIQSILTSSSSSQATTTTTNLLTTSHEPRAGSLPAVADWSTVQEIAVTPRSSLQGNPPAPFTNLFDEGFLSGINLNDPMVRQRWVGAVAAYFNNGFVTQQIAQPLDCGAAPLISPGSAGGYGPLDPGDVAYGCFTPLQN